MRIPRIYHPEALAPGLTIDLDAEAARHVARVLRMTADMPLVIFDGSGGEYGAVIGTVDRGRVTVTLKSFVADDRESPLHTTLAQGISRGERMDYTLRKAVELGVSAIQPLFTEYCQVQLKGERLDKRMAHWRGVVIAACEQSGRNRIPPLHTPCSLPEWLQRLPSGLHLALDPRAAGGILQLATPATPVSLLVGPEGGLSENEMDLLRRAGYLGIRLGPRILRTETAALAALAALQSRWGDMS